MTLSDKFLDPPTTVWVFEDQRGFYAAFGKRALDLVLVSLSLPICLLLIGALIMSEALRGRPCFVLKHRVGECGGRFRTVQIGCGGLADLPMLWNVFRGEMSLVGPRPMTREGAAAYRGAAYFHLRPGLIAPVAARCRPTSDAAAAARQSAEYMMKQGLFYDLFTLCRYCLSR